MNKKILGSVAALVAVLALVAGGTFAAWSDFDVYDNSAGAEHLTLDVSNAVTQGFVQTAMAPGVNREFDFVVASRDGQVVPNAALTLALQNLVGTEDGCQGNSETLDDAGLCATPGSGASLGEYIEDARISINASSPTTDIANACNSGLHPRGSRQGSISLEQLFNNTATTPVNLLTAGETLQPGEGICVAMGLELPVGADNASQGDSATWDFRYDLTQIVP